MNWQSHEHSGLWSAQETDFVKCTEKTEERTTDSLSSFIIVNTHMANLDRMPFDQKKLTTTASVHGVLERCSIRFCQWSLQSDKMLTVKSIKIPRHSEGQPEE